MNQPFTSRQFGGKWNFLGGASLGHWKILDRKCYIKDLSMKRDSLRGIRYKRMRREISKEIVKTKIELMELTLSRE